MRFTPLITGILLAGGLLSAEAAVTIGTSDGCPNINDLTHRTNINTVSFNSGGQTVGNRLTELVDTDVFSVTFCMAPYFHGAPNSVRARLYIAEWSGDRSKGDPIYASEPFDGPTGNVGFLAYRVEMPGIHLFAGHQYVVFLSSSEFPDRPMASSYLGFVGDYSQVIVWDGNGSSLPSLQLHQWTSLATNWRQYAWGGPGELIMTMEGKPTLHD